jgi:hypothetical protein
MRTVFRLTTSIMAILGTGLATAGETAWPRQPELSSQICVERPENNGVLNIREADVVIEGGPVLTLLGGQAVCAYVPAGRHTMWVQSRHPYDPASLDPQAWKSSPITLETPPSGRAELFVCGEGTKSTYTGWAIRKAGERCE